MLCAAAALGLRAAVTGEFCRFTADSAAVTSYLSVGYLIVFGSVVAYSAYERLLQNAPSRVAGTYAFVSPLVAVTPGRWLLGEQITLTTGLAAAVIAIGVALIVLP